MGAIAGGSPKGVLRKVVKSAQMTNYRLDTLECGHDVADYDNRVPKRRRCDECALDQAATEDHDIDVLTGECSVHGRNCSELVLATQPFPEDLEPVTDEYWLEGPKLVAQHLAERHDGDISECHCYE